MYGGDTNVVDHRNFTVSLTLQDTTYIKNNYDYN